MEFVEPLAVFDTKEKRLAACPKKKKKKGAKTPKNKRKLMYAASLAEKKAKLYLAILL